MLMTTGIGSRRLRHLIGCIVAYVLVVQGLLVALSGARLDAATLGGAAQNVELCLHDAGSPPDGPDRPADGKAHCAFCLAAVHQLLPARIPAPAIIVREPRPAWLPEQAVVASSATVRSHQPRGPPLGA